MKNVENFNSFELTISLNLEQNSPYAARFYSLTWCPNYLWALIPQALVKVDIILQTQLIYRSSQIRYKDLGLNWECGCEKK